MMFMDLYLLKNVNVQPIFLKIIAVTAVELSIKNNEELILSLQECVNLFAKEEEMYTV